MIYDNIVSGLASTKPASISIDEYLKSLQKPVRELRVAYRNLPINVPYKREDIQAAYLAAYLPHYYQLIYKIFLEDVPNIFQDQENLTLTFIGGGPGSEAFGAIKYIINNCSKIKRINISILDLNASTWQFSHNIVLKHLINTLTNGKVHIELNSIYFDLVASDINDIFQLIQKSNLLVIQNCLNEVANTDLPTLKKNIRILFNLLPDDSYLLMSDLTSGARPIIKQLENLLVENFAPKFLKSTLNLPSSKTLISVHHRPSPIIVKNLLNYTDGLIPRKNLIYDYSILSKGIVEGKIDDGALGFAAIYRPLDFKKLDANDYLHKKTFVGIDFGTSTTVVGIATLEGDKIVLKTIPVIQKDHLGGVSKSPIVPSIISLIDGKRLLVGKHAYEFKPFLEYGKNTWHSFKQNLYRLDEETFPDSVLADNPSFKISNAKEGIILFFNYIKKNILEYLEQEKLSQDIEYSISIPAGFTSKEKYNLKSCLLQSGIECEDTPFMEEPNAALINYLFENNISIVTGALNTILVLDLGAGTVDVSILEVENGGDGLRSKLLSVVRIGNIGGNVIDTILSKYVLQKNDIKKLPKAIDFELVSICEQLKIKLCKSIFTDNSVNFKLPIKAISDSTVELNCPNSLRDHNIESIKISYSEFHSIMLKYWNGTESLGGIKETIDQALKDALLTTDDIDKIIITGGGGRNPYIKNFTASLLNNSQIIIQDNIQEQVARGVALQSLVLNSFGKNIITPILCDTAYIEGGNKNLPLFSSGMAIPTDDIDVYIDDNQKGVGYIASYWGENEANKKYFEIFDSGSVKKLVFHIAPNQELICDIIYSTFERAAKELFDIADNVLLNLK